MKKRKAQKPKLYVFKSNKHIYAQIIDHNTNKILTSSSTLSREIKNKTKCLKNCKTATIVGQNIGKKLQKLKIKEIIFDRGKNIYHGQVKALANGARETGIIF
uniref:Large ribosomal subunit protein uL18c n=1 Tax=Chondria tumulosa TaxID=2740715 RepID=A0A896SRC6_9FLOR|nr:ribosomal protein L18 [Chondria tumulosa]QSD57157.1 ribosomal protein L18 [Chondria tumulosa]